MPEDSFFGEGCLPGQPLRMATACTIASSTFVRVEKATMLRELHQEPDFAERFLAYVLSRNIRMEAWCFTTSVSGTGTHVIPPTKTLGSCCTEVIRLACDEPFRRMLPAR